jgi:hypothetical protein
MTLRPPDCEGVGRGSNRLEVIMNSKPAASKSEAGCKNRSNVLERFEVEERARTERKSGET